MCVHVRVHGCVHVHVHVHAYARVHVQALSTDPADAPAVVRSLLRLLERGSAASKGCAASEGWVGGGEGGDKARDELLCGALLSQWRKSLWREKPPFERSRREMHLRWWTAAAPWGGGYVLLFVAWGGHCGAPSWQLLLPTSSHAIYKHPGGACGARGAAARVDCTQRGQCVEAKVLGAVLSWRVAAARHPGLLGR